MSQLAISQRGDGNTLIDRKEAEQEKNMQTLVGFIGSFPNHTPNFDKFIQQNPWVVGKGQRPQQPFIPFGNKS
jgi:hypothetical protein